MRYLFIHPVFPGQFHKLMETLAADPANQVVHLSQRASMESVPGVKRLHYKIDLKHEPLPHPFLGKLYEALQHGDAIARALQQLKQQGFTPDLIYGYAGWGHTFYVKDVFPDTPFIGYFEWYMNPFGSEYNFDPNHPLDFDKQRYLRICNANMLVDLQSCDGGITPTRWQQAQFPQAYRSKLQVIHDGVDTDYYAPAEVEALELPGGRLPLRDVELLTYSTRGMEPFRGFPEFMRALAIVQQRRPRCHAVIVGSEEIYYSRHLPDGRSYKQALLEELGDQLDLSRIHFTGWLAQPAYREVLRASRAHVYLTYPYVLSWSLMEAMSTGCLLVGSRTAPVEEVIQDGHNGLLVDFFDHQALATQLEQALARPDQYQRLRDQARQTVLDHYSLARLIPEHARWLKRWQTEKRR